MTRMKMITRRRTRVVRIDENLALLRKSQINSLRTVLGGLTIHEVDLDRFYVKKLRNINILKEFMPK